MSSKRFSDGVGIRQSRDSLDAVSQQRSERPVSPDGCAVDRYRAAARSQERLARRLLFISNEEVRNDATCCPGHHANGFRRSKNRDPTEAYSETESRSVDRD